MANFILRQTDTTSIYSSTYAPSENQSDGVQINSIKPLYVFVRSGKGIAIKLGLGVNTGSSSSITVSVPNNITDIDIGLKIADYEFSPDSNYPDEKLARILSHSVSTSISLSSINTTNSVIWLICKSISLLTRKTYSFNITVKGSIGTATFPVILTTYNPVTEYQPEAIKYISDREEINKVTEHARLHAARNIKALERGLIPRFDNIRWKKTTSYFKNGKYNIMHDSLKIGLVIHNYSNNPIFKTDDRYLDLRMVEDKYDLESYMHPYAYEIQKYIHPFLIWVNQIFISWDRIEIVKSDDYFYLIIDDIPFDTNITSVKFMSMPDSCTMLSNIGEELDEYNPIAMFSKKGYYGARERIIYDRDNHVKSYIMNEASYDNYQLDIPFKQKICADNMIVFNQDGTLDLNPVFDIKNGNIFTLNNGAIEHKTVICLYSDESNENAANMMNALNESFTKNLISNKISWDYYNNVKNLLLADFDFEHSKSLTYDTNIANSQLYMWKSNVKRYDEVFYKHRYINIMEVPLTVIQNVFSGKHTVFIPRDLYPNDKTDTFPIVFQSGMIPSWYETIDYTSSYFSFLPISDVYNKIGVDDRETLEIAFCRGIHNELLLLDKTTDVDSNNVLNVNVTHNTIPSGEEVIYADIGLPDRYFPIRYSRTTIDSNTDTLTSLDSSIVKDSVNLYIGSTNQFIYKRYDIQSGNAGIVELGSSFKTAYNTNKFMIFLNGKYINRIYWKILMPMLDNPKITKLAFYTIMQLNDGDRLDVFYIGTLSGKLIEFSGDLLIKSIKTKAFTDGQKSFKVPYPYSSYPRTYDSFFCIKDNGYVDKSRYAITSNDTITFSNESFSFAQDIVFVFPYYKPIWEHDESPQDNDNEYMISIYKRNGSSNVKSLSFNKSDLQKYFNDDGYSFSLSDTKVMMYFGTTFIHPDRYHMTENSSEIIVNMDIDYIYKNEIVTLVFDMEQETTNDDLEIKVVDVVASYNNQYVFDIPESEDFNDAFFVIVGSVVFEEDRYFISPDNKLFIVNRSDYRDRGETLSFVFIKDTKEDVSPLLKKHYSLGFYTERTSSNITDWKLPTNYFKHFRLNNSNTILFENSTYISNNRYYMKGDHMYKTNSNDPALFRSGSKLDLIYAFRTYTHHRRDVTYREHDRIYFTDKTTVAVSSNTVKVPWIIKGIRDTEFLITVGSDIVSSSCYSLDSTRTYLIFNGYSVPSGTTVRFTFVHNWGYTAILKSSTTIKTVSGIVEYNIPSPFYRKVDLRKRMIITIGNKYLDSYSYMVDNKDLKIWITNTDITNSSEFKSGANLTFYFFYTGSEYSGISAWLPESGYVAFSRSKIKTNMNKELYLMFVNGQKVAKSELLDVNNSLYKVKTDIKRRFDLVMLDCAPRIEEFKNGYDTDDDWTKITNYFDI